MHRYIPNTDRDVEAILEAIGLNSKEDLFKDIPEDLRLKGDLNLMNSLSELELMRHKKELSGKNKSTEDLVCFLGAGAYDHFIPSVVKHMASRAEFYTAYTPYQPEISQGTLQMIFEYQTMMCNLTGLDVSNASMYDGPTACSEAALMAVDSTRRNTILVSKTVHPEVRKVLKTYLKFREVNLVEIDMADGVTDVERLKALINSDTA